MKRIIGGEFEIGNLSGESKEIPDIFNKGYYYSSGRAALYHILMRIRKCGKKNILLPDYICESVVYAVKLAAVPYSFYSLNQDLTINIETISKSYNENSSILIVNYFGGIDVKTEINKVKQISTEGIVILDNVQALFSMFEPIDVDFMFTSFRKQLPVPDGGWVLSKNYELNQCLDENSFAQYKLAGAFLKGNCLRTSVDENVYLNLLEKGESLIDSNINSCMSDITKALLHDVDIDFIRNKRIENSSLLINGLRELGLSPVLSFSNNKVPLFVPIRLKNRNYIRALLREYNVFCPVHWPKFYENNLSENKIFDDEISLVIDQRYNYKDIQMLLSIIEFGLKNEK